MLRYLIGFIKNLFNPGVGIATIVDSYSKIDRLAKTNRFAKFINSSLGSYSYVGNDTWVTNADIGNFCSISNEVNIGLASHTLSFLSTSPIFTEVYNGTGHSWTDKNVEEADVCPRTFIGNDVWIGSRAMIKSGLTIGDGAIIGAGAIVTKDVPPYAIVVGVPARVIRYRFDEKTIGQLLEMKWWKMTDEELKHKINLFQQPVTDSLIMDYITNIKWGGVKIES